VWRLSNIHARPRQLLPHCRQITLTFIHSHTHTHTSVMDSSSILKHIPNYRVMICMLCEKHYCIPPDGVKDHLYRSHQDKLTKKRRGELVKFAGSLDLAQPEHVKMPKREEGPVPFLYKEEGFECARCGYCCPMESSMMKHGKIVHKNAKNKSKRRWIQVCIPSLLLFN
jgi:Orsellinic acid/F9775 biosynthesis cluster protein D